MPFAVMAEQSADDSIREERDVGFDFAGGEEEWSGMLLSDERL